MSRGSSIPLALQENAPIATKIRLLGDASILFSKICCLPEGLRKGVENADKPLRIGSILVSRG
jgi:hypothetical protein